jgi:hypothetical protein
MVFHGRLYPHNRISVPPWVGYLYPTHGDSYLLQTEICTSEKPPVITCSYQLAFSGSCQESFIMLTRPLTVENSGRQHVRPLRAAPGLLTVEIRQHEGSGTSNERADAERNRQRWNSFAKAWKERTFGANRSASRQSQSTWPFRFGSNRPWTRQEGHLSRPRLSIRPGMVRRVLGLSRPHRQGISLTVDP